MRVCLVTPFAWSQPHDVNEHVAGLAGGLRALGHEVTVIAPSTRAAAANHLTGGSRLVICSGNFAWAARMSNRPTAHALLYWPMSATRSIISLLLVMLCAVSCASMAVFTAVPSPKAIRPGSRNASTRFWCICDAWRPCRTALPA